MVSKPASRIRAPDNDSIENEEDYLNDFDDYADSLIDKSREADDKQSVIPRKKPDPFASPAPESSKVPNTISNQMETKARTSNINIQDMRRLNSKLNKGSADDFEGYDNDYGTNQAKKPENNPFSPKAQPEVKPRDEEPTFRNKNVIQSKDKPVTIKTGPVKDPEPIKQNLRLDTEQKNRLKPQKNEDLTKLSTRGLGDVTEDEQEITNREPKPIKQESDDDNYESDNEEQEYEKDREPVKMSRPAATSVNEYADEDIDALTKENEELISQLTDLTSQMDDRVVLLKKSKKIDKELDSNRPNSAIKSRKQKLDAMARKMKLIKSDIENMTRILDNSYKIDSVVDKENKSKEQEMILNEQKIRLKDCKKAIKQQKLIKEYEMLENAGDKIQGVNRNYQELKEKLKNLKNEFTEEDKRLKVQHEEVQILKERNRKIKDYIGKKKKLEAETGVKQNVTKEEIEDTQKNIIDLESKKKDSEKQWRQRVQLQDDRVKRIQHESTQLELKLKEKENEYRMINLKIKELKRTIQGTFVSKQNNKHNRKKSARSVTKNAKPPVKAYIQPQIRPNSSEREGLAESIQKQNRDKREFEMPVENNTVTRGVDFNGGNDDYYEENEYENEFEDGDKKPEERLYEEKNTQEETFRDAPVNASHEYSMNNQSKEYYSRRANEDMINEMRESTQNIQTDPPVPRKQTTKPNFLISKRN